MNTSNVQHDLIVLVADKNMSAAVKSLLGRGASLGIRSLDARIFVHPEKDPGCLLSSHDFLRAFRNFHTHAIVIFDREGCGKGQESRQILEAEVESALAQNGWEDRAKAIVIDPELEVWVWSDSPEVGHALGWSGRNLALRQWLTDQGYLKEGDLKPCRPKEAMEAVLRLARKPRSSAIYRKLAETVGLRRCTDSAFQQLKETLRMWFPPKDNMNTQNEEAE